MIPLENLRKTEVQQQDGTWVGVQFSQVEPGDIFRQFDPDGTLIVWEGKSTLKAMSTASLDVEHI